VFRASPIETDTFFFFNQENTDQTGTR